MLAWTVIFLLVAVLAGSLGFKGIEGAAAGFAKVIFLIAIALFFISLVSGWKGVVVIP